ncbi:uncharacterized protein N7483_009204 [Penicillium malachiteum]|uniref:uncharacterized protein n=1 Tax=Penicillium malachiteum TaxID=1324776 RepID=UPI002549399D|nr:uncharacterized protein N7483_009204 [Penicillium malachiteum]KAJ5721270.1 hypothetical protein N7483_009204 [Penicillium malachiteum]
MSSDTGIEDSLLQGPSQSHNERSKSAGPRVRFDLPQSPGTKPSKTRRAVTLYDSVAGRVNVNGFNPSNPYASKYRDTQSSGARDLRPEEILYRPARSKSSKAAKKNKEHESYFAHEKLPADRPLPPSELLTAIHSYSSDFYTQLRKNGKHNFHSMDESALLAVGILMEELAKEQLGETGDLALTEEPWTSEDEDKDKDKDEGVTSDTSAGTQTSSNKRSRANTIEGPVSLFHHMQGARKKFKRNRLTNAEYAAIRKQKEAQEESPKKKQKKK